MVKKRLAALIVALSLILILPLPANAATYGDLKQNIQSESAILMDADTGQILFEKNMHEPLYPASITKIMTALLALESGSLDDVITMTYDAVFSIGRDTSHIALDVDERLTLEQALYALALESANDAANGIAELIGGSMEYFAQMMTNRAKEAGALNTTFTNAHGLPDEAHLTTAYDMARITMAALSTPQFTEIFGETYYEMPPTNKQPETRYFRCSNAMVVGKYQYDDVIVDKTGWTSAAQNTLVTVAQREGRTLIVVVMKSQAAQIKWNDTISLLDYGFDNFYKITFSAEELAQDNFSLISAGGKPVDLNLASPGERTFLIENSLTKENIEVEYVAEPRAQTPEVSAVFSLASSVADVMYPELGDSIMQVDIILGQDIPVSAGATETSRDGDRSIVDDSQDLKPSALTWILRILGSILVIFSTLFLIRKHNIKKRRKLRRRKNLERWMQQHRL